MWDSGPSQNVADSGPLKMVQQRALCQAVSTPPQSGNGTPACSASRDGIASQVREVDKRAGTPFLFFNLLPTLLCRIVDLQCCDCCQCTAT